MHSSEGVIISGDVGRISLSAQIHSNMFLDVCYVICMKSIYDLTPHLYPV